MLVHEYLFNSAHCSPDKLALVSCGERLTYGELARRARIFAATLQSNGLARGDRVVIFLENSPEAVVALFGVLAAGLCMVIVNPLTTPGRLAFILQHSGAKLIVSSPVLQRVVREAEQTLGASILTIVMGRNYAFSDPPTTCGTPLIDEDLAAIIYTSGSTGRPKGVVHLHRTIHAGCEVIAEYLQHTSDDVILSFLPLSSSYGLLQILVTFMTGGSVVLLPRFGMAYDLIQHIEREKVTGFAGSPTVYAILLRLENVRPESISTLRYITNAAAGMPPSFVPKLRKLFPATKIYLMHGLTECLRTTYLPPEEIDTRTTSVGTGMKNVELWIEDADGKRLGPGGVGEMMVRSSCVMPGYWNAPEENSARLLPGRFPWEKTLRTGDIFRMDQDGYFHFVARVDEVLKVKGEKVSPLEVEEVIYQIPGVAETRVIGVPHEILGRAIRAEIVLLPGHSLTAADVQSYCKEKLEEFKVPAVVAFVECLPKTEGGKIKRTPA